MQLPYFHSLPKFARTVLSSTAVMAILVVGLTAQPYNTSGVGLSGTTSMQNNGQGWGSPDMCQLVVGWDAPLTVNGQGHVVVHANAFFTGGNSNSYIRYIQYSVDGGGRSNRYNNPGGNWGGWDAEIGEWRIFSITLDTTGWSAGVHTVYVYAANGYTGGEAVVSFQVTVGGGNVAPTVDWYTPPSSYILQAGVAYPIRAMGHDDDANLGGVAVQYQRNTDGWVTLAWDGVSGSNQSSWISNNNSIVAGNAGDIYQFRCLAWDLAGLDSGWITSAIYTVSNAPAVELNYPGSQTITAGMALSVASHATHHNTDLTQHNLDIRRPDGLWNYESQGAFAFGEPFMGPPLGAPRDSTRTAQFAFNQTGTWQVRSWATTGTDSAHSDSAYIIVGNAPPPAGTGTGLPGTYYDNQNFTGTSFSRVDATVDFDWGSGAPGGGFGSDSYSARWVGQVEAPYTGTYTFLTWSDDGVKLTVGGQTLINNWTDHAPFPNTGTIALTAGQKYPLVLEYYENGGGAVMRLRWTPPGESEEVVPQSRLYGPNVAPTVSLAVSSSAPAAGQAVTWTAAANDADGSISEVKFYRDGGLVDTDTSAPYTYEFTGAASTTYAVHAIANDNSGGTTQSSAIAVTYGAAPDTQSPDPPTILGVINNSLNQFTITWSPASDNVGVAGYEIWFQGVNLRASVSGNATQATVAPFGPGELNYVTVVARDSAGNSSEPSNEVIVTTPASSGLGGLDEGHFFTNINTEDYGALLGDQIVDRVSTTSSPIFSYFVSQWHTENTDVSDYLFDSFDELSIQLISSVTGQPGELFGYDVFGKTFVGLLLQYDEWENYYTYFDLNFVIWGEVGERVSIYSQDALDGQDPNDPDGWPVDIARWKKIQFLDPDTNQLQDLIEFDSTGIQMLSYTVDVVKNFIKRQYFMVRYGRPIRGISLDIGGEINVELGLESSERTVSFADGTSFTVGTELETINLNSGEVISVVKDLVFGEDYVTLSTGVAILANQSVVVNGNTISVDSAGYVIIETAQGLIINSNMSTGAKSIVSSSGWGVSFGPNGAIKLIIPPGASPTKKVVASAIDILGKVIQIEQGAVWSVRDLLGNVINLPSTGTPLDLLDLGVSLEGDLEIGVKVEGDGPTIWVLDIPTQDIEKTVVNRDYPSRDWNDAEIYSSEAPIFGGESNGDMIKWELKDGHSWGDATISWEAVSSSGQVVNGPSGVGLDAWEISNGDSDIAVNWLEWAPGNYTISVEIILPSGEVKVLKFKQQVGWRTEEYVVVGQVKPLNDVQITVDQRGLIKSDIVLDMVDAFGAPVGALIYPPAEIATMAWFGAQAWATHGFEDLRVANFPNLGEPEKLWMIQYILNYNPDLFNISQTFYPGELYQLTQEQSYRMFSRTIFKYTVDESGRIASVTSGPSTNVETGPTKISLPGSTMNLPDSVVTAFDWISDPLDILALSPTVPDQITISSDRASATSPQIVDRENGKLASFVAGRVGQEGQYPNYALFRRNAPFIFAETIFGLDSDSKSSKHTVRLSVDKIWKNDSPESGTRFFNEIRIFKRKGGDIGAPFELTRSYIFTQNPGMLSNFINSVPLLTWPGDEPEPSTSLPQ